jgi:hypothetical protein
VLAGDRRTGVSCDPHPVVTAVDTDVVDRPGAAASEREEDQVAGTFRSVRYVSRPGVLRRGVMWQVHPEPFVDVLDQSGAVEPVRSGRTPHVRLAPLVRSNPDCSLTELRAAVPSAPVPVGTVVVSVVMAVSVVVTGGRSKRGGSGHQPEHHGKGNDQSASRSAGQGVQVVLRICYEVS